MKDNKGVTLVSLVIMIIVLLIISSIAIYSGKNTIEYVHFTDAKSQMEIMNSEVNLLYQEYSNGNEDILSYGLSIDNCNQEILRKTFEGANIEASKQSDYRYLTESLIKDTLNLDGIEYEYLVDIKSRDVILFDGITYDEKTYYTLKDFAIENVEYEKSIARIGTKYYSTLQLAIDDVATDNVETTVILIEDTSENITVKQNQNIVLELGYNKFTGNVTNNGGKIIDSSSKEEIK